MSKVLELETAVRDLTEEGFREFRQWFLEFDNQRWDKEFEGDIAQGKLDVFAEEALAEPVRRGLERLNRSA